ncbi:diguanylate cyclase [Oscillochloris sp. ZM17-4]|uniref:sensor domain-containing diguanylate cyclase n=1 Tax=Oscillochloris sp. ZM17-4 TaxID=2866714 RepID=UPI001C72DA55|nr:diguanylate cyclase [Oscillochloris sp. ZM17-4]MBX0326716.1 diguanylate cyclase [Oscillochloris sp. ZM17-4]
MNQPSDDHQPPIPIPWDTLVVASSDGIMLLDPDDRVLMANPAAAQIFGDGLVGSPLASIFPPAMLSPDGVTHIRLGFADFTIRRSPLRDQGSLLMIQAVPQADAEQQRDLHEQKLYDLLMIISSSLDIPTILERVAQHAMELIGADASSIPLYDAERDTISTERLINLPDDPTIRAMHTRSVGLVWDLVDTQRPLMINNYQGEARAIPALVNAGVSALIAAPIAGVDRTLFGVLALYRLGPDRGFTRHDLEQLVVIGRQTGIAIQNARLYEEALREAERRHLLYLASIEIGAALDPENLYHAIHRAAKRLMICDSFTIALYEQERQEIAYVYIADHQGRWPSRQIPIGRGLLGHIIRHGVSLRLLNSDPEIEEIFGAERLHDDADLTRSMLATVLHTGEQIVGAITVQAHGPRAYTSNDLDVLETLASTAAIAVQNARLFARIQEMATTDALTQVPNRRHFFDVATYEIERTDRYKRPLSLIMFDIDSFKAVNDTYGHLAGDEVLREVAQRCCDDLRDIDTVARFGGEEFVALLPETSYEQAILVAQRLRTRICARPVESDAGPITVTISIGADSYDDVFAGSLGDLIDRADQALYVAKNSGRNKVVGFRSLIFGKTASFQASADLKNKAKLL